MISSPGPKVTRASLLLTTTSSFCQSLLSKPPKAPRDLISKFFVPKSQVPKITEHGPQWARSRLPFLFKTFSGTEECVQYFLLLGDTLKMEMEKGTFPSPDEGGYVVDADARASSEGGNEGKGGIVSVVGKARFESVKTGKGWNEEFIYRFSGFDEEGRIGHWEIWADPLSAWVACEE